MSEYQNIESAPRDGAPVVLYSRTEGRDQPDGPWCWNKGTKEWKNQEGQRIPWYHEDDYTWRLSRSADKRKQMGGFFWFNFINMVEIGGPFETADEARQDCANLYKDLQGGVALDVAIFQMVDRGRIKTEKAVCEWQSRS